MQSSEGEGFDFRTMSPIEGAVENWMSLIEDEMRSTLQIIAKEGVFNYARAERFQCRVVKLKIPLDEFQREISMQ